jgi:selenocysteine lyase/cysteine desulfurase
MKLSPGDEFVISKLDHEANIAAWVDLAEERGITLKWWAGNGSSTNPVLTPESLEPLLSEKTRLVTCTHTSNILGTITDVPALSKVVHKYPRALFCVDGVAFAPHRKVDVKALGVDFYVLSWYKVYGPHLSMLYTKKESLDQIRSLGHFFNPSITLEDKLGLAGANYELTQSLVEVVKYLGSGTDDKWSAIAAQEGIIQKVFIDYLNSRKDVTIYGETSTNSDVRVPVISFTVNGKTSESVVDGVLAISKFAPRAGHMYSKRLIRDVLGKGDETVIRVSLVHYNTGKSFYQSYLFLLLFSID